MAQYISFQPSDYYKTNTYTGTGSELAITDVGFQSDSTLIKESDGGNAWNWFDSVRGATKYLKTSGDNAEATDAETLKSWESTGYTVGTSVAENDSGQLYAGYNWKMGTTSGLTGGTITPSGYSINTTARQSVIAYTGTGSAATIPHGLGVAPDMIIVKELSHTTNWAVFHTDAGAGYFYILNETNAKASTSNWNSTLPTSTLFNVGGGDQSNTSGRTYVAYCFANTTGYSSIASYTGNGNANGPFINCGFRPSFVMTKYSDSTGSWCQYNDKVLGYNPDNNQFLLNDNGAAGAANNIDLLSNGFKIRVSTAESNDDGGSLIYAAFAEFPFVSSNSKAGTAR
jgi:hypothetical protein